MSKQRKLMTYQQMQIAMLQQKGEMVGNGRDWFTIIDLEMKKKAHTDEYRQAVERIEKEYGVDLTNYNTDNDDD